jgi:hypothetical protein
MSGVFQKNIDPPPPHRPAIVYPPPLVRREDTLAGGRRGGGSIYWKTPDTALYSTYLSTLWEGLSERLSSRQREARDYWASPDRPCSA